MLTDLAHIIQTANHRSTFVVLHQLGSHGQAYHKRYPKEFERFAPICQTSEIQTCSQEALINTYDNSIAYTDFFVNSAIEQLKAIQKDYDVALWYVSDHGESLGENNMFMHGGMPYFMAPDEQTLIPSILWLGNGFDTQRESSIKKTNSPLNHDYVFHTLLGLFGIKTSVYESNLDLTAR
ncbi:hypothetical protein BBW65_05205 [Helicobacter enhydrae]|uniref:Sulfatase N-terminal domain-containing protein n=1 Tax=Helicobacter enhydrae TaxID=222136 RepID=A0A1B1U625_9HELI|nr:sulfatase-like hydrolase/transferase [Helicobacter enhydrae]ANV98233.1 hypothetical protein BBW65_05205 [Helicobacter enhydrae]